MNVFDILREKFQKEINNNPSLMPEAKYWRNGIYDAIKMVDEVEQQYNNGWIPADKPPKEDEFVLLSFTNFSALLVGRYEEDENGNGAYYVGDEDVPLVKQDIFVNAWMPLPPKYED